MNLIQAVKLIQTLGPTTLGKRIYHACRLKSGWIERIDPHGPFGPEQLARHLSGNTTYAGMLARRRRGAIPFFFDSREIAKWRPLLTQLSSTASRENLAVHMEALKRGRLSFFSHWDANLGDPIDWQLDPSVDLSWPRDRHWRHYSQFDPSLGDIKMVWEASRFSQCFLLTRAWALTGNPEPLRLAVRRIEEWIDANPPVHGVQWTCGQEIAFRLMAWSFALNASYGTDMLDEGCFARIIASIYRQAQRIARHIGFSRSLRNNHSLSEAVGLYTIGLLFPEFDNAERWRRMGKRILIEDTCRFVFDDGTFIQHSTNYHRVMLHVCTWALRLGQLHGDAFPALYIERLRKATALLYQLLDEPSGRIPNYGANDGARILQLTSCEYLDYRPVLQMAHYAVSREHLLEEGPWNEALLWMYGPEALCAKRSAPTLLSSRFDAGGYYTLRGRQSWGMVRCHSYTERPNQADMLHFDLWWRGQNILRDAGSYSYHCPSPWRQYFVSTAAHNTIVVDELDQMTRGPRFMWFDWCRSRLVEFHSLGQSERWQGEHDGYRSRCGVVHRRTIERFSDETWTVTDELVGKGDHRAVLHWHLLDAPWQWTEESLTLCLKSPVGEVWLQLKAESCKAYECQIVRGLEEPNRVLGWESLYYGVKVPHPVIRFEMRGRCPMKVVTRIGLGKLAV